MRQGVFREDLFHRLNVIRLRLPALRERREDIATLARFFLQKSAVELGVDAKRVSDAALKHLEGFDFPGNVRQLENICHWLTVMAPTQVVEPKDLPPELQGDAAEAPLLMAATASPAPVPLMPLRNLGLGAHDPWLMELKREAQHLLEGGVKDVWDVLNRRFEAQLIQCALEHTRGRRIEAAQKLGIGRNTITRKIQELGLD